MVGKILIVEDESDVSDLLTYNLEAAGFSVAVAQNGRVALNLIRSEQPALLVLDHAIPVSACRELQAEPARHRPCWKLLLVILRHSDCERESRPRHSYGQPRAHPGLFLPPSLTLIQACALPHPVNHIQLTVSVIAGVFKKMSQNFLPAGTQL